MKFAVLETTLGLTITGLSGFLSFWYLPGRYLISLADNENLPKLIFINPGLNMIIVDVILITLIFLGLAVLGCGVYRLARARAG